MSYWSIYLISVINVGSYLTVFSAMTFLVCGVIVLGSHIFLFEPDKKELERVKDLRKSLTKIIYISIAVFMLGALIPSQESLIRAYFIAEGSKVINAKNVDIFAKELSKKADDLIKNLGVCKDNK